MKIVIGIVILKTVLFMWLCNMFRWPWIDGHDVYKREVEIIFIKQNKGVVKCATPGSHLACLCCCTGPAFFFFVGFLV
jgi:hypothetical protein